MTPLAILSVGIWNRDYLTYPLLCFPGNKPLLRTAKAMCPGLPSDFFCLEYALSGSAASASSSRHDSLA
jgi:hypothetical protein